MIRNDLQQLLLPVVEDAGYELWGCEYLSQGKHSLLRVYIDKADGIGIEDCQCVSHRVSAVLDVEDPIPGYYSLEVSSPGIPRPLFYPEHYQRYHGHSVALKLYKTINGCRRLSGLIESVSEESVTLKIGEEGVNVPFSQIVKANLTGE